MARERRQRMQEKMAQAPGARFGATGGIYLLLGGLLAITGVIYLVAGEYVARFALAIDILIVCGVVTFFIFGYLTRGKPGETRGPTWTRIDEGSLEYDAMRDGMHWVVPSDEWRGPVLAIAALLVFAPGIFGIYKLLAVRAPHAVQQEDIRTLDVDDLVERLEVARTPAQRVEVINRLAELGADARPALEQLRKLARAKSAPNSVRISAQRAIRAIEGK